VSDPTPPVSVDFFAVRVPSFSDASDRGRQMISDLDIPAEDLPLLICACGRVLKRPSNQEAAQDFAGGGVVGPGGG
jgi:hypothetical protein